MRPSKKMAVIATGVAVLMAFGTSSAMAKRQNPDPPGNNKVKICHFESENANEPWHEIEVDENAVPAHEAHGDFVITPDRPCPPVGDPDPDPEPGDETHNCSAESTAGGSSSNQRGLVNVGNVDLNAGNLLSNLLCQSNLLNNLTLGLLGDAVGGGAGAGSAEGCTAESTAGDSSSHQRGLVNVGNIGLNLGNLGSNALCQSNLLNNATAAVLGHAVGSSDEGGSAEGCSVGSTVGDSSSDQQGLVNVGNVGVNAGNLLGNALCQSDILNNATVVAGGLLDGGLLDGGLLDGGLLGGDGLGGVLGVLLDVDAGLLAQLAVIL